jgi:site-specific DNA-methyltransferase (adenine-specific)
MKPYYKSGLGKLYQGDCLEITSQLTEQAALVCIDPPYNIGKDTWDKIDNYQEWMGKVFLACQKALKDNGSFYWFHNKMPVIARLMGWIEDNTDFIFKQFIVWDKWNNNTFQMGNDLQGAFYKIVHNPALRNYPSMAEYCLFYTFQDETGLEVIKDEYIKPQNKFAEYLRDEFKKAGICRKEIAKLFPSKTGGLTGCVSNWLNGDNIITKEQYLKVRAYLNGEYLRKEYEYLRKEYEDLRKEYEDLRYTFNQFNNQTSVWSYHIPSSKERMNHPTQKPTSLIENILKHSSNENDLVLDCFLGSGTTAVACENLKRRWVGIEREEKYCEIAAKRIEQAASQMSF